MAAGVSLLSDVSYSNANSGSGAGSSAEHTTDMEQDFRPSVQVPTAKYTKMGETLRHVIPGHMQCSMACGGRSCKYENPSRWSDKEQAIRGLYSSWITDNLLAMARPSTEIIEKYNIISQFLGCGLKTIINLQRPGEHASCGYPLEPESGFTYRPEVFMKAGIYFYNFGWKDYGVASLTTILDMVKVMSFAVQEGRMAIHCHAGLGRTGVLLACYLVFTSRMSADQAILFVRAKRPSSIQTRGQLLCVREFARFAAPLHCVFPSAEPRAHAFTLSQYLARQRHLLHGYEARHMKHVPKIVYLVCRLLVDIAENKRTAEEQHPSGTSDLTAEVEKTVSQQALQQLGKEMRGKGILVTLPHSLQSSTPPPEQVEGLNEVNKAQIFRSVSDSALDTLGCRFQRFGWTQGASDLLNEHRLFQTKLSEAPPSPGNAIDVQPASLTGSSGSLCEPKPETERAPPSPGLRKRVPFRETKRSRSLLLSRRSAAPEEAGTESSDVPLLVLHAEFSPEVRHVVVARALVMDVQEENLRKAVLLWQTELNCREGAWERLCIERDPLLLSALMWSWLEQLKEPVLTQTDVEALSHNSHDPLQALAVMEKGHKETLLCILDCAARLTELPDDVEAAVLHRTIGAFTRVTSDSENGRLIYKALMDVLVPVLYEMRRKALDVIPR